jgi:hypothetical protein
VRDGVTLEDKLTGHCDHFDLKRDAEHEIRLILAREQGIDWSQIDSYDYWHGEKLPRPCVEVYAYDKQGFRIIVTGRAPMTLVGYHRDGLVVAENLQRWLQEMGHAGLPRKEEIAAERERQYLASIFDTVAPGARSRPSGLAAERQLIES